MAEKKSDVLDAKPAPAVKDVEVKSPEEQKQDKPEGWTAQQGGSPELPEEIPGQVFVKAQLPDPEVQQEWGIDPEQQNAGLIVLEDAAALKHPSGPEPDDVIITTGIVSGEVRQPDTITEADGSLRVPDGVEGATEVEDKFDGKV